MHLRRFPPRRGGGSEAVTSDFWPVATTLTLNLVPTVDYHTLFPVFPPSPPFYPTCLPVLDTT